MVPARSFTAAVEDYLKAIYELQTEPRTESLTEAPSQPRNDGSTTVTTTALGGHLGVTAGSASGMLKKLDDLGLIVHAPYHGVRLNEAGRAAALAVVRRHRLVETFLARTLGLSWDELHDEAEALEHAVSPRLCDVIDDRLGHPGTDPHGDPIPTRDGQVIETPTLPLRSQGPGRRCRVARVSDRVPGVLRRLSERGIGLGDVIEVVATHDDGAVTVRTASDVCTLAADVSAVIRVVVA